MDNDKSEESMFAELGRASLLPQYDDITYRRMEAINANANLRTAIFRSNKLYDTILVFHQHFGALWDSTMLELVDKSRHISEEDEQRIRAFLFNPFSKTNFNGQNVDSAENRAQLIQVAVEANQLHEIYETALKKAGYRKISISVLKDEHKWRGNF